MDVSKDLKTKAVKMGLCKGWTDDWTNPNLDELVEMYISGLDWCILNDFPSNEYIKTNFGEVAENHGVFTDTEINTINPDIAILNGSTNGHIELSGFVSRDIFVRHDSEVIITIRDNAKAFIRVYDNAKVTVDNQTTGKVFIYKYVDSFMGKIFSSGDVVVRERKLKEL